MNAHMLRNQRGLTLVEILIVVILLGIIAAVAIPQFGSSTKDARENTLDSNLGALRNAIELYAAQHNGLYPGQMNEADGVTATSTDGEAAAAFIAQLTQYSDVTGKTSVTLNASFPLGPYFRKGIPANPVPTNNSTVVADFDEVGDISTSGATTGVGWLVAVLTGQIVANDDDYDHR